MKLLVDDERVAVQQGWEIVRNHDDFVMVMALGSSLVEVISLDHDLGEGSENCLWCLRWLVNEVQSSDPLPIPKLKEIIIHTANRVGGENMIKYLTQARDHVVELTDVKITWLDSTVTKGHVTMPDDFDYSSRN